MAYHGSDLGEDFKKFFRLEKRRITKYLTLAGCTSIKMDYGFHYFMGWFNAPNGQLYYFSCSDVRHFGYSKLLYRTAKDYHDFSGGINQYVGVSARELKNINLR